MPYDTETGRELEYLPRVERAAAYIIESIVIIIATAIPSIILPWPFIAIAAVVYETVMYRKAGGLMGHLSVGARVVDRNNGKYLSWPKAFLRGICRLLDLLLIPLLINIIMVLVSEDRRHLYDHIAGSVVVMKPKRLKRVTPTETDNSQNGPA